MLKLVSYIVILMTITSYIDAQTCRTIPSDVCSSVLDTVCSVRIKFLCMPSCDKCGQELGPTFIHEVCDSMESTNDKCGMFTNKCIEQCEGAGSVTTYPETFPRGDRTIPRIRSRIPITGLVVRPTPVTAMTTMTSKTNTMASSGDNDTHADDGDDDNTAMIVAVLVVLAIIVVLCIVAAAWYLLKKKSKEGSKNDSIAYTADNLTYEGTGEVNRNI
ncbi:uncharacterized protein [Antedon mediterranea]|uniref:uncharacterized protein isoform X1 n=1 Tax=Antedon mediterranea TaxID=105859 RepID=UPI003AF5C990